MQIKVSLAILTILAGCLLSHVSLAQCPTFSNFSVTGNAGYMCEGDMLTVSLSGQNIPPGSSVDFYLGTGAFNPYNGGGDFIGSVPVTGDPCNNTPEVLYIMVNPDNAQVGSGDDRCDEFIVLWTGSGGFNTSDIIVSNLSNGTFQWNDFVAGTASTFNCGVALPPGPVPPNAILIIQGATTNNVPVDSDILCASGLPVYIIANNNTVCTGGWFDNDSPCASCPVQIDINGAGCTFMVDLDYSPPANPISGWGWSNMGTGAFANVVPPVDVPAFIPPINTIPNFLWTVPSSFCETYGEDNWLITGILNPEPMTPCTEIFTPYFDVDVSCPELILSGGGYVCEGNCPDAPNEITFTIEGGDVPFEADLQITASLFPPFAINDLSIVDGQQIFICLGGIFPAFDPTTNTLTIPSFAVGLTATVTIVSLISASGCPIVADPNFITLNFIEAASADAGSDQTICSYEQVLLDGSIGGSATNSIWTSSGDGDFADPSDLSTTYTPGPSDLQNESVILTLTGTDPNDACIPAESVIVISIEPSIIIETGPPITICNTDVANIFAMVTGPNEPGAWETTGDGTFLDPNDPFTIYEPGSSDIANGSVTLIFSPVNAGVCIESNEPLEINFVNAPTVNIPQNIEVCTDDTLTLNINVSGNFTNITWSSSGDGELLIVNSMEVTYVPGPQDISDQFTTISVTVISGFSECGQTTYNIPVNIVLCDCPPFETSPLPFPLCAESSGVDLTTLIQSGGSGVWSITTAPSGSNPAKIVGNFFLTDESDAGTYTITYTLNSPEPGCPATSSENIIVAPQIIPVAGPDIPSCGPSDVVLNGVLIPSGSGSVLWQTLGDGSFVNPMAISTSYIPGTLDSSTTEISIILQVMDPVCGSETDTMLIFYHSPPETLFSADTFSICNEESNGSVIDFLSTITGGDASGVWTNSGGAPVDFSDLDSVNFNGVSEGFYTFSYQTNSAVFPCPETDYNIVINVEECLCPLLQIQSLPEGICNTLVNLNLAAFVMAGGPGSWQTISTPPGANPAFVVGSILQTLNTDPGTYRLRFTFDAAPLVGCPDSAEIDIRIQESPVLTLTGDAISCGLLDVQYNVLLGGSATGVVWSSSGSGVFNDANSLNPIFMPTIVDLNSSQVTLFVNSIDTFGYCNVYSDSIVLMLSQPPSTSFSAFSTTICNHPDSGSVVNLTSFISGGDGTGSWTDLDGAMIDLGNPNSVDFDGVAPGTYTLSYLTQTAVLPCVDSTYNFTVFVEDCSCPSFIFGTIDEIICGSTSIDLNSLVIDAAIGSWSVQNGPSGGMWPSILGSTVNTNNADPGDYDLIYELADSISGCPATQIIPFTIELIPSVIFGASVCDNTLMTYSISFSSDADSLDVDFGILSATSPGNYLVESIPSGQDITIETFSTSRTCSSISLYSAPDCNCTLFTEDISDTIFICPGDTFVLIPFITGTQGLAFSTWISDVTLMKPTLPLFEPKTWIWIVRDSAGCERRDTFAVALRELIVVDAFSNPPTCNGLTNGSIIINDIDGGQGPYTVQLDNLPPFVSSFWPDTIQDVGVGNHMLTVTNSDGCETITNLVVEDDSPGNLDLGSDQSIPLGDSVFIDPNLTNIYLLSAVWDPVSIATGVEPFWYIPQLSTLIQLIVTDSLGCIYEDELFITVLLEKNFFVPNIFTPNIDQVNDVFEIFTSSNNNSIHSLEIFDRWGNIMHYQKDSGPCMWDGNTRNQPAPSGVYVVKLIFNDDNGNPVIMITDLTLIR